MCSVVAAACRFCWFPGSLVSDGRWTDDAPVPLMGAGLPVSIGTREFLVGTDSANDGNVIGVGICKTRLADYKTCAVDFHGANAWGASKLWLPSQTFWIGSVIVALLAGDVAASRAVTYSYSGDTFTTFSAQGVPPSNAEAAFAGKSISGEFTIAAPLKADFNGLVTPTQFSFSGGLIPLTSPTSYSFDIQTNASGAIIDWMISIQESVGRSSIDISFSNAGDFKQQSWSCVLDRGTQ